MHIEPRNLMWTLMPLFLAGALCSQWKVVYQQQHICAVRGSSVVILCSFYYTDELRVKRFMWGLVKSHLLLGRFISDKNLVKFASKFQYIGDEHHNCSLKIHQVEHNDAGKYAFKFMMNSKEGKWYGLGGSTLKVVDLNILVTKPDGNRTIKEGDCVNLTCINSCDGGNLSSAFTWFKNGEPINEGPVLYLSNMSSATSGNYTCSVETHTGTASGVVNIDVEYGPKNTSVSARPSTKAYTGSNITLICSSCANPPVENYTWFKKNDDDNDEIMDAGHLAVFFPDDGGQYFCSATNKHGSQNSSVVTVTIKSCWITFTRDVLIIAAFAVLLIGTTVIAIIRLHKKRTWKPNTDTEDADYVNWLNCDNQSQEGNQCQGETTEVIYTAVYFNNKRKSNMEQQMDVDNDENVIYITVCRNQPPTPSYVEPP